MTQAHPLPNIMEALEGVVYPATAQSIVGRAEDNRAARPTLNLLGRLPDRIYRNAGEVNNALGQIESDDRGRSTHH